MAAAQRRDVIAFRKDPFVLRFRVNGKDLTGATFAFAVKQKPDDAGAALFSLAGTATEGAAGVRIVATGTWDGLPWTDVEIIAAKASISALPAAAVVGDDVKLAYDFQWTEASVAGGFSEQETTILYGDFVVKGSVND